MKNIFLGERDADIVLIQPVDDHDLSGLDREYAYIREHCSKKAFLAAVLVDDWNRDLSPWEAPPVFGKEAFGAGAAETLAYMQDELLPEIRSRIKVPGKMPAGSSPASFSAAPPSRPEAASALSVPAIIGGYSLAAFFALWSVYQTDIFSACAAASPSVWFPGWMAYAKEHTPQTRAVYLSLGDREKKTRNPVMATVADCIQKQDALLDVLPHTLEWNPGNHFAENEIRTAKGFVWAMEQIF